MYAIENNKKQVMELEVYKGYDLTCKAEEITNRKKKRKKYSKKKLHPSHAAFISALMK